MSTYRAPLEEMKFVLNEIAGLAQVAKLPGFEDAAPDTVAAILDEAAKFATNVLDPLNGPGDREGATRLPDGSVKTPAGFKPRTIAVPSSIPPYLHATCAAERSCSTGFPP